MGEVRETPARSNRGATSGCGDNDDGRSPSDERLLIDGLTNRNLRAADLTDIVLEDGDANLAARELGHLNGAHEAFAGDYACSLFEEECGRSLMASTPSFDMRNLCRHTEDDALRMGELLREQLGSAPPAPWRGRTARRTAPDPRDRVRRGRAAETADPQGGLRWAA